MYEVLTLEDLDNFIITNTNKETIILLYFGASWCGPCKLLKEKLADEDTIKRMPLLKVVYIDTDNADDISCMYKIKSLPTQIFINLDNLKVKVFSKIEGYDYTKLLLEYDKYVETYFNDTK